MDGDGVSLAERLRSTIASGGPIPFARFMEAALYDPDEGFYEQSRIGERADFVTSPHVSPAFGELLARQIEEFRELLGDPASFTLVEAGAGDGTLARQLMERLPERAGRRIRYIAIERSSHYREQLRAIPGLEVAGSLRSFGRIESGCLIANEVLDNLPFARLRHVAGGWAELFVGMDGAGRFVLVEGSPSSPSLLAHLRHAPPGTEVAVSLAAFDFLDALASLFRRGYALLIDYGYRGASERATPVHGYRTHTIDLEVLDAPGARDITAGIDVDALATHARARGLAVFGPVTQRDGLLALGFAELDEAGRRRQVEAIDARRGIESVRIFSNRNRARQLIANEGLGGFWFLGLGIGTDARPRAFR